MKKSNRIRVRPRNKARVPYGASLFVSVNRDITDRKQVEEQLRQSEERFSKAFHSTPTALILARVSDRRVVDVNESFLELVGRQREEVIGQIPAEISPFPNPEQIEKIRKLLAETNHIRNLETDLRTKSGEIKTVLFSVDIIELNRQPHTLSTMMDITPRIQAEKKVIQMKRLYATLSQVNQTIVRVKSREDLYQSICDVVLKFGELSFAWIGLLDETTGDIRPVAASGMNVNVSQWPFPIMNSRMGPGQNAVVAEALRTANVATSEDVQVDERTHALQGVIKSYGFRSLAAVPFQLRCRTIGVLNLISVEPGFFKAEEELLLLSEMGLDISFALDTLETERERRQAEAKVERQNRQLKILHEIDVAILAADSLENITSAALSHIRELIDCQRAHMSIFDWGANEALIFKVSAMDEPFIPQGTRVPLAPSQDLVHRLSQNQLVLIEDLTALPNPPPLFQAVIREGSRSVCILPLFSQGNLIGTLNMSSEIPGFFDEEKIDLGLEVANQVAIAITQKQLLEELLESEEKYRAFFQSSMDAILLTSPDGSIRAANPAACRMFGRSEAEICTLSRNDLVDTDDPRLKVLLEERERTGKTFGELNMFRQDGSPFPVEMSSALFQDGQGNTRTSMIIRDITARKQAEQRLLESEQKYSVLFEKSAVPAVLLRLPEVVIVDVNEALEKLTGYTKQEFIGKTGVDLGLERREVRERMIAEFEEQGSLYDNEVRIITKSGEERIIMANTNPVELNGQPYALTTAQDITERRRAEDALRSSQAQMRGIFDSAMDAIISADTNQNILLANMAAEQMFGYQSAEMIGKSLHELLPEKFREKHQHQVSEYGRTGITTRAMNEPGVIAGLRAGGVEFPAEASISQISVGREKIYTVILRDITERKRYEEELHALNAELEHRVTERTLELNRANIELEHANKAKDEFLATMSHKLRTPLNSILGLSESLLEEKRGPLNHYQQHALGIIGSSGQHLLELINDILDLSKIDAGKFDYYPQAVSVDEVCRASMAFVKEQAVRKSVRISYNNETPISSISADPRRLKQVLVNLLSNAVKFTPEGGNVTLEITCNLPAEIIRFSVIDTGIGITPEDLQKLFQPFVQLDSQLNRQYAGTGLGLALVQKLTDLQGGSVEVESELGKGSRFTINLSCRQVDLEKPEPAASQALQPVQPRSGIDDDSQREHEQHTVILLVEDNPTNVLVLSDYLESHGFEILIAHDGAEAIEIAAVTHPDLILMDIQMPVMDGLEAIRRLRATEYSASIPIIALTALVMPGDRERCLEVGASEYMSKPVSLKTLGQKIKSLLNK